MIQFDNTFQIFSHLEFIKKLRFAGEFDCINKINYKHTSTKNEENILIDASMLPKLFQKYAKRNS
jgi:hypothetical protein